MQNDSQTKRLGVDLMVGVLVLLTAAAVIFLIFKAANLTSWGQGGTYALVAKFDNIGGLKPRAPVKSAGVVVGRIGSITFENTTFRAAVTLEMDSKFQFPKDTSAKILTSGLLGEQYIGLEAGGDEKNLAAGETIKMTQSAVVLENLISQFIYGKAAEGEKK
jgi:phospholipid/cholesterol/gamma-HCH transport system substrate-binding protein